MAHRILEGHDDVAEYDRFLDDGWPERVEIAAHICKRLQAINQDPLRILELCTGPGILAAAILETVSVSEYIGIDISAPSLSYTEQRVSNTRGQRAWVQADLNDSRWLDQVRGQFDAIVSMQSVHDLGGEVEIRRILGITHDKLNQMGRFIYADLLRTPADAPDSNPGRFTVSRHLDLLRDAGFSNSQCTLQLGPFGCFEAIK